MKQNSDTVKRFVLCSSDAMVLLRGGKRKICQLIRFEIPNLLEEKSGRLSYALQVIISLLSLLVIPTSTFFESVKLKSKQWSASHILNLNVEPYCIHNPSVAKVYVLANIDTVCDHHVLLSTVSRLGLFLATKRPKKENYTVILIHHKLNKCFLKLEAKIWIILFCISNLICLQEFWKH